MNVGIFRLGGLAVLGVVGLVVLISFTSRSGRNHERSSPWRMVLTLLGGVSAAALLAGLLIPAARIERGGAALTTVVMDADARGTTSAPTSVSLVDTTPGVPDASAARNKAPSRSDSTRNRVVLRGAGGLARPFFIGLSLAALIVLARVAADGRKSGGYSVPARIIAVMGFVGICALLAKIGPILH